MRWLPLGVLLAACEPVDGTLELCEAAPLPVTWDNFGRSFVTERCQSCHGSGGTGEERRGAPVDVSFDTEEDVWRWAPSVLGAATGDAPSMPPMGGVEEDDRYLLEVWLTCGG